MYKYALLATVLTLSLLTYSCKSAQEKKADELKKQVEDLHDDLMVKTEDLVKLRTRLAKKMNEEANMIQRAKIKVTIGLINAAESFMEDWMSFYGQNKPQAEDSLDDAVTFYEKQMKELERMEKEMDEAMEAGKEWIDKLSQE